MDCSRVPDKSNTTVLVVSVDLKQHVIVFISAQLMEESIASASGRNINCAIHR